MTESIESFKKMNMKTVMQLLFKSNQLFKILLAINDHDNLIIPIYQPPYGHLYH